MARTIQTRKRSRGNRPFAMRKRRRISRRSSGGRKTVSYSSVQGTARSLGFSRKRTSLRKWRSLLWNSSIASKHFRSNNSLLTVVTTPATLTTMSQRFLPARLFGGNDFWLATGGAIDPDSATMPTFSLPGDITIRGGIMGITLNNQIDNTSLANSDPITGYVYLIKTGDLLDLTSLGGGNVTVGWDPSLVRDFQSNVGKILKRWKFNIQDNASFTIEQKMPIQKIDTTEYQRLAKEYAWFISLSKTGNAGASNVNVVTYYNLSFVGDVV